MVGGRSPAIILILALAAPPVLAETYKWVDAKGVVNYSNKPPLAATAKPRVIEERISVVAPDPSVRPAIAAMQARAERRARYEEADFLQRQSIQLAAQSGNYSGASGYGVGGHFAYADWIYNAGAGRYFPPIVMHHRGLFPSGGRGGMHSGRGSR